LLVQEVAAELKVPFLGQLSDQRSLVSGQQVLVT